MRTRTIALTCFLFFVAWSSTSVAYEIDTRAIDAVWQAQQFEFRYFGGTRYSCGGLQERVRAILLRLGARPDLKIAVFDCELAPLPARVFITLTSPMPATDDTVRRLTTYDERQRLIARARGEALPGPADLERVRAVWESIQFSRDAHMDLRPADCELVRQIRREIIPKLAVRVEREKLRCSSAFGDISKPRLTVDALVAAQ